MAALARSFMKGLARFQSKVAITTTSIATRSAAPPTIPIAIFLERVMVIILGIAAGVPLPASVTSKGIAARGPGRTCRPHNVCGFFQALHPSRCRAARVARGLRSMARARPRSGRLQSEMGAGREMGPERRRTTNFWRRRSSNA
ncbi:hypothetical protein GCM10008164_40980 [Achromobacter xylosoxidans]|nr:hypothetical protein GCM10008164_40980 [Achromobacter xylosoxidans]